VFLRQAAGMVFETPVGETKLSIKNFQLSMKYRKPRAVSLKFDN